MERYHGKKVVIIWRHERHGTCDGKDACRRGAHVLVTDRSQAGLESAQKELGNGGIAVSSDARSLTGIDALAARVKAESESDLRRDVQSER